MLEARGRCAASDEWTSAGIAGTGGTAFPGPRAGLLLLGEAARNVRSVIDPELPLLCNEGRSTSTSGWLLTDPTDTLLCMRLVCTLATGDAEVG